MRLGNQEVAKRCNKRHRRSPSRTSWCRHGPQVTSASPEPGTVTAGVSPTQESGTKPPLSIKPRTRGPGFDFCLQRTWRSRELSGQLKHAHAKERGVEQRLELLGQLRDIQHVDLRQPLLESSSEHPAITARRFAQRAPCRCSPCRPEWRRQPVCPQRRRPESSSPAP